MIKRIFYFLLFIFICALTSCTATEANKEEFAAISKKEPTQNNGKINRANLTSKPKIASRIFFLNENEGWALCLYSKLCHTDDGGYTWRIITDKNLKYATEIYFVNSEVGWGVISEWVHTSDPGKRAYIVRTQDGGKTWKKLSEVDDASVLSMSFIGEKKGYLTCKYCAYQTNDGKRWTQLKREIKPRDIMDAPLHLFESAIFVSPNRMWGYGGAIWFSDDDGKTWETAVSYDKAKSLYGSYFLDEKNGWIVGSDEQIWHMRDGKTWERIKIPESLSRNSKLDPKERMIDYSFGNVSFVSTNEGWICRREGSLFYTNDEGNTWQIIYQSAKDFPNPIVFLDSLRGFALNDKAEIIFTNDGGHSWNVQPISVE